MVLEIFECLFKYLMSGVVNNIMLFILHYVYYIFLYICLPLPSHICIHVILSRIHVNVFASFENERFVYFLLVLFARCWTQHYC